MFAEIIQKMTSMDWIIFAVTIFAYFILEVDIIKNNGQSQNFFTWFLWGILDSILLITTYKEKGSDLPIIAGCVIGSFFMAFSLLFVKKIRWRKSESRILLLVILTVIIWLWSGSNLVGILFAVVSEMIAGIPLMRASWKNPGSIITLASYVCFFGSYILSMYSAPNWHIFPISFLLYSVGDTTPLVKKWINIIKRYQRMKNA
jgi:hypothetical protein